MGYTSYLCVFLVVVLVIRLIFITKQHKKFKLISMVALLDFEAQVTSLNNSFTALQSLVTTLNQDITTLNTQLTSTLGASDAETLLTDLTSVASKFAGLIPPVTPPSTGTTGS